MEAIKTRPKSIIFSYKQLLSCPVFMWFFLLFLYLAHHIVSTINNIYAAGSVHGDTTR